MDNSSLYASYSCEISLRDFRNGKHEGWRDYCSVMSENLDFYQFNKLENRLSKFVFKFIDYFFVNIRDIFEKYLKIQSKNILIKKEEIAGEFAKIVQNFKAEVFQKISHMKNWRYFDNFKKIWKQPFHKWNSYYIDQ